MAQTEIKRYLVFGGLIYYPGGGWEDFLGSFGTLEACDEAVRAHDDAHGWGTWSHVYDTVRGEIINAHRNIL